MSGNDDTAAAAAPAPSAFKRLKRPDDTDLNREIDVLNGSIEKANERLKKIKETLDRRHDRSAQHNPNDEFGKARKAFDEIRSQVRKLSDERTKILDELKKLNKQIGSTIEDNKATRKEMRFFKVEEIEEQIRKLDFRIETESLTIQEEKRIVAEISELKKSKPKIAVFQKQNEAIDKIKDRRTELEKVMKEKQEAWKVARDAQTEAGKVLDKVREKNKSKEVPIKDLIAERNRIREEMNGYYSSIRAKRAEHKKKLDNFYNALREQRKLQQEERKRRDVEMRAQRKKEAEERKKDELLEAANLVPFFDEMNLCDTLCRYLQRFVKGTSAPSAANNTGGATSASNGGEVKAEEGMAVYRKENEEGDIFHAGAGKKRGRGKKNKRNRAKKGGNTPIITHSLGVLTDFGKLKLKAPSQASGVAASIEELKAKKEWFKEEGKKKKEELLKKAAQIQEEKDAAAEKAEEEEKKEEGAEQTVAASEYLANDSSAPFEDGGAGMEIGDLF